MSKVYYSFVIHDKKKRKEKPFNMARNGTLITGDLDIRGLIAAM